MKREFRHLVSDILQSLDRIIEFTENMTFDDFVNDDRTASAVIRKLEIIGEAAKNLPASVTKKYSDVPWREMARMRDKLIHAYFGVDDEIVWKVVRERLPGIRPSLQQILEDAGGIDSDSESQ